MNKLLFYALIVLLATSSCEKNDRIGTTPVKAPTPTPTPAPTPTGPTYPYNFANSYFAATNRFDSAAVFRTNQLDTIEGVYGSNKDYNNVTTQLPFSFYGPKITLDTMKKRPFVLCLHGGGFLNGTYTSTQGTARQFALRGYTAASVEYRQGFNLGVIPCLLGDSVEVYKAVYRAVQDANAAMRYFINNANTYGIDTSQLYVYGSSAGNVTTTAMIYYTPAFWNKLVPNVQTLLGGLNDVTNSYTGTFNIKAELTHTGYGLKDKTQITAANCRPTFYMQGSEDSTLPLEYGPNFQCPTGAYGRSFGSNPAKLILKSYRFPYEQYIDVGAEHNVSTNYPTSYSVSKMSRFIKRLWAGDYRWIEYSTLTKTVDTKIP